MKKPLFKIRLYQKGMKGLVLDVNRYSFLQPDKLSLFQAHTKKTDYLVKLQTLLRESDPNFLNLLNFYFSHAHEKGSLILRFDNNLWIVETLKSFLLDTQKGLSLAFGLEIEDSQLSTDDMF